MTAVPKLLERRAFSDADYLELYPDVRVSFETGRVRVPWNHYDRHGRHEGRVPLLFDASFYQRAYPQVAAELRQGRAETPLQHFVLYGRGRGYLPHPKAVRAANPAAAASRFGGLWIDAGDAEAKIQGRQETGLLTDAQAERLRFFATNGYVILERAVEEPVLEAA
jgi:hypothetical protein